MYMYIKLYTCLGTYVFTLYASYLSCVEDYPTIKQLQDVMRIKDIGITTRWRELGQELLDSNDTLQVIEADHPNGVNTCCRLMFEKWLEKTPNASWSQLVTALNSIELNTAADAVSKRYELGTYIVMYYIYIYIYIYIYVYIDICICR